jgi:hypothetical protein
VGGAHPTRCARAGVRQYVIVNLRNRTAEVYAAPDAPAGTYPLPQLFPAPRPLGLRVRRGECFALKLGEVLP